MLNRYIPPELSEEMVMIDVSLLLVELLVVLEATGASGTAASEVPSTGSGGPP